MSLLDKIFGTESERKLKKIMPLVDLIESKADHYAAMSDDELRSQTDVLKGRLAKGETLDDILPDAFATVREADWRVLAKRPFRVQLMGGIILHRGNIAEMKTGEGKTLVATLPAYLNALTGEGVHIVTVNEYLARMGYEEMGRVYGFLGLTTGMICHGQTKKEKRAAYACDIVYGTNNEFGFDYLRDNMVIRKENLVQRKFAYAIVDEVDSILIDEARTPLIISGQGEKSTELYDRTNALVRSLRCHRIKEMDTKELPDTVDADYIVDEKARTAVLTATGVKKAEAYFGLENLSDAENSTISHHVNQAIRAFGVMKRDVDYVVKDGEVLIVDSFTGRIMPGRRYSNGLHQAIEAKEGVEVEKETKTLATITFQNFFRMYEKLAGMTGTALTEKDEFEQIYNLGVVEIPTNKPMIRRDHNDLVYRTVRGKYHAILEQIEECHKKGQPVLVGTVSVDKSEELSEMLKRRGIQHTVLNAKHHEKEAEIVAMAGKLGKVTISTNMAGRGTDIMLGGNPEFLAKQDMRKMEYDEEIIGLAVGSSQSVSEEVFAARAVYKELFEKHKEQIRPEYEQVCAAGGLFIIGTERHESRRIDNQLRGRSGRQGDPGESRFFLSLEDDLMRLFGSERIASMVARLGLPEDEAIDAKILSGSIESAQKRLESDNFGRRRNVLNYDDVMNQQRNLIYKQRREVLDGKDMHDMIRSWIDQSIEASAGQYLAGESTEWDLEGLKQQYYGLIFKDEDLVYSEEELGSLKAEDIVEMMHERATALYDSKDTLFEPEQMREIERIILLNNVDAKWMDHLDAMDDLRGSVGLNAYANRSPLVEYRLVGGDMFDEMIANIREDTIRGVLSVTPKQEVKRETTVKVTSEGLQGSTQTATQSGGKVPPKASPVKKAPKVGRNDPCPCGSGKKYKKCCGMNQDDAEA
ncbi:MAG: preprotein translocase subunit SecA [Ruminococcaceae bacterium]|nr:preprotein translocase subunit SecA [Oscillospiraceae bacterium]